MDDSSNVQPVQFRRHFENLPRRKKGDKKKRDQDQQEEQEETREEPRKGPPPVEGNSTIDLTA